VNISGKVDLISFYTDSPRLGVRNVNAAEKTQDRIGATMWQQPQKYVQHSAVMFADRITTPLMLITGAQDSNVPADNTREMYYALRRLGKECVWVNYMNGGHGGAPHRRRFPRHAAPNAGVVRRQAEEPDHQGDIELTLSGTPGRPTLRQPWERKRVPNHQP
jgi:fermentation-respiration switch protein FrsA (DUF1100 family)